MEDASSSSQLGIPSRKASRFLRWILVGVVPIAVVLTYYYLSSGDPRCATLLAHLDTDVAIPLPTNCMLTTDAPADELAKSLDDERKRRGLAFRAWISCKPSNQAQPAEFAFTDDPRWLPSYVPGAYQFRQTVIIIGRRPPSQSASGQPIPQESAVVAELCLMPLRRYASQISGQCDGKFAVWK